MDNFGKKGPHEQHNHGPGLFIGGDNYGGIRYEMLDPNAKAALTKLSKLLPQALRDGIISPDVVAALQNAARNINDDVAEALWLAGRNINEDVAESLWLAGQNINKDVAENILRAAETISTATDRLDYVSSSLNKTVEKVNGGSGLGRLARLEGNLIGSQPGHFRARHGQGNSQARPGRARAIPARVLGRILCGSPCPRSCPSPLR